MKLSTKKPLAEQLKLTYSLRAYLDAGSHEFNSTPIEEKVNTLARLVNEGFDLNDIVKHHKHYYRLSGYKHIKDNTAFTLKEYISYLATNSTCHWQTISALEEASDKEITKLLTELLKEFILKNYDAASLVLSYVDYKFNDKPKEYKRISKFLKMNLDSREQEIRYLEKVLSEKNYDREAAEKSYEIKGEHFQWDELHLFTYLKDCVLPELGKTENYIKTENYLSFGSEDNSDVSKGVTHFMNKHFPKNKRDRIMFDRDFKKSCTLKLAINLVEVLYFDKPMLDYNVFHIKNEFMRPGYIEELFENDQAALLVEDDFREIENNPEALEDKVYRKNRIRFVKLWDELNMSLAQNDTLIVASYRGCDEVKIGLIPQGSKLVSDPIDSTYKKLQLEEVKTISKRKHLMLDKITRSRNMLNKIQEKSDYVSSTYVGKKLSTRYENLSEYSIKLMCMEWLRTEFAPKGYRLKYLTKVSRKELSHVDINGLTEKNEILAAQVIFKNEPKISEKAMSQFYKNKSFLKLIFSEIQMSTSLPIYDTREIFNQLAESDHRFLLANLVGD